MQHLKPSLRIAVVDRPESRAALIEEALRDGGVADVVRLEPAGALVRDLEKLSPDVVIFDLGAPSRQSLEETLPICRALARPILMFVDHSDEQMTGAAIDAGVSAYVVDGLRSERLMAMVDLAIQRFTAMANLQKELHEAKTALAERRVIDKAKVYLMSTRKLTEANAYALLRGTAMRQGKRIVEIAQALLTAADLLDSKSE